MLTVVMLGTLFMFPAVSSGDDYNPVTIQKQYQIKTGNDDAMANATAVNLTSSGEYLHGKYSSSVSYDNYLRFTGVEIPVNAVVNRATIVFTLRDRASVAGQLSFYAETSAGSAFTSAASGFSSRTWSATAATMATPALAAGATWETADLSAQVNAARAAAAGRTDYVFKVVSGNPAATFIARSYNGYPTYAPKLNITYTVANAADLDTPFSNLAGVNLTLRGDASTGVYVNWSTARQTTGTQPECELLYWPGTGERTSAAVRVVGVRTTYDYTSHFKADITGLQPDTVYSYIIRDTTNFKVSQKYTFRTARAAAAAAAAGTSFLVLPDINYKTTSGYENSWTNTLSSALARFPDAGFVLHTGEYLGTNDAAHWAQAVTIASTRASEIPIVPTTQYASSANRRFAYNFNVPQTTTFDTQDYAIDYGNALLLVLNSVKSTGSTTEANKQAQWIRDTVAQQGGGKWIMAAIGTSFYGASSNTTVIKKTLEKAFEDNGVSIVFQGKDKAYARSYLIRGAQYLDDYPGTSTFSKNDGVIYLTAGNAGSRNEKISTTTAKWVAVTKDYYTDSSTRNAPGKKTYSYVSVTQDRILVTAYTADGEQIDSFEINKQPTPPTEPRPLVFDSLNNAFGNSAGSDAATTRSFGWKTLTAMGTSPYVEIESPNGTVTRYSGTSAAAGSYFSGQYIHKVAVAGLTPNTAYRYRIGNTVVSAKSGTVFQYISDWYKFETAAPETETFSFIHMADSQGSSSEYANFWGNTLTKAVARDPNAEFIIHTGDMVDSNSSSHWTGFLGATGTNLAGPAFLPTLGNHEGTDSTTLKLAEALFNVPSVNYPLNYSFSYGNAFFIVLNTNYTSTSKKTDLEKIRDWVRSEIQAKGKNKFIIVSFHKAPYGGKHQSDSDVKTIIQYWTPTFDSLGVDLVLNGHDHNYIRSYPIKGGVINTQNPSVINTDTSGIVYQVTGHSGKKTYSLPSKRSDMAVLWKPVPSESSVDACAYSVVTVSPTTVEVKSYSTGGVLIDSYSLTDNTSMLAAA
jgi:hypothetical protein